MRWIVLLSAAVLIVAPAASAEPAHVGYPSSIASLGDSDSTGFDSRIPGRDSLENVWSTGANPEVQSHYLRILAHNPQIKGHSFGFAQDGSQTIDLARQARIASSAHVEYLTIETGGNDICGGRSPVPVPTFQARYAAALQILRAGLPNARIFVTSIPFDTAAYDAAVGPYFVAHGYSGDGGLCDPRWDAQGVADAAHEIAFQKVVDSYNTAIAQACAQFVHCRYDGGALAGMKPVLSDFSLLNENDPYAYTHPSVQGHMKMAALTWPATFDFTDASAPVSKARRSGRVVTLTATDGAGVSGIEYRLSLKSAWTRYARAVTVPKGKTLTWRAVDVNGNSEASHSLRF